jgi:hypothetical protein
MRNLRFLSAALAAIALSAPAALAQPAPPPLETPLPPPITQRVSDLERDNVQIKARLAALEQVAVPGLPAAAPTAPPATPGVRRVLTVAEFNALYPAHAIAPGVASNAPFPCSEAACGPLGCSTTLTTSAISAASPEPLRTYGPVPEAAAGTSISARGVVRGGGTSGCSAAGCSTGATRGGWYLGKNLGR